MTNKIPSDSLIITQHAVERYFQRIAVSKHNRASIVELIKKSWDSANYLNTTPTGSEVWGTKNPYPCRLLFKKKNNEHVIVTVVQYNSVYKHIGNGESDSSNNLKNSLANKTERLKSITALLKDFQKNSSSKSKNSESYQLMNDVLYAELAVLQSDIKLFKKQEQYLKDNKSENYYKNNLNILSQLLKSGMSADEAIFYLDDVLKFEEEYKD